jgi:hypothetical protein
MKKRNSKLDKQVAIMMEAKTFIDKEIEKAFRENHNYNTVLKNIYMKIFDYPLEKSFHRETIGYFAGIVKGLQMAQTNFYQYKEQFGR